MQELKEGTSVLYNIGDSMVFELYRLVCNRTVSGIWQAAHGLECQCAFMASARARAASAVVPRKLT